MFLIYKIHDGWELFWTGAGWTVLRTSAKQFETSREACLVASELENEEKTEVFVRSDTHLDFNNLD